MNSQILKPYKALKQCRGKDKLEMLQAIIAETPFLEQYAELFQSW